MARKQIARAIARLDAAIASAQAAVCPPVILLHFRNSPDRCFYCGVVILGDAATIDHIKPRHNGGDDSPANIVPACDRCNNLKGDTRVGRFRYRYFPDGFWAEIQYRMRLN